MPDAFCVLFPKLFLEKSNYFSEIWWNLSLWRSIRSFVRLCVRLIDSVLVCPNAQACERGSVRACERAINHSFCCFAACGRLFKIKNFWTLQTNEQPNEQSSNRKNKIAIKQMNEPSNKCTNKRTNKRTNKQTNKRTNKQTNKRTNKRTPSKQTEKVRVSLFLKVSNYWITPIFKWSYKPKFVIYFKCNFGIFIKFYLFYKQGYISLSLLVYKQGYIFFLRKEEKIIALFVKWNFMSLFCGI